MARSVTVAILERGPGAAAAKLRAEQLGHRVITATDPAELLRAAARLGAHVIVVPDVAVAALREARHAVSIVSEPLPLLALCADGLAAAALEALRADADDVLPWPAGESHLGDRLAALAQAKLLHQEVNLRRLHAQMMQELAATMASSVEFEDLLLDVLLRLVETTCASSAMVLVRGEEEQTYYVMGVSDDPGAVRLPVPATSHPEVAEALQTRRDVAVRDGATGHRAAPLRAALRQRGLRALWAFPLLWEGEAYGCLELCFEDEAQLPEATVDLLREVTALLGYALRSSEAYAGLREQTHKKLALGPEAQRRLEVLHKYEEFFERAFDGIVVVDRQQRVLHMNPAGAQITGYSLRGLVGSLLSDIVAAADRPALAAILSQVSGKGTGQSYDLSLMTTSGDPILVSVSPSAVLAEDELVVLSFRDVTEARALEEELRSTKEFLERLIDSTVDAILATDVDGRMILFNKGAERIFGLTGDEVIGKRGLRDLFPEGMAEQVMAHLRGPDDGGVGRLEAVCQEVLNASGELVPVTLSVNLIYQDGEEVGTVGIYSDRRERLRIERTLAQAQEKLIETEKQALIAELAGTTAHELNQPLTSIMGYAELLKRRIAADDSNHRAVDTILNEAERMAEIVRKIGKITRYETKAYVGGAQILDLEKSSR